MLTQMGIDEKWIVVPKRSGGRGGGGGSENIRISKNYSKSRKNTISLRISIPIFIGTSAGFKAGDYAIVRYTDKYCQLIRTTDIGKGYKLSDRAKVFSFAIGMTPEMSKIFFPNGEKVRFPVAHEVSLNNITFTLS